jgi:hypothetical protein
VDGGQRPDLSPLDRSAPAFPRRPGASSTRASIPTKNTYAQVDEAMGMMEARSVVDQKLANLESNRDQFRLNEAAGFLEGMNQDMQAS